MVQRFLFLLFCFVHWSAVASESWQPSARPQLDVGVECHSQTWSWRFLNETDQNQRAELLHQYLELCTARLQKDLPQGRVAEKLLLRLNAGPWPTTTFSFVDRKGQRRQGWHLLQSSSRRRPAVVVGCEGLCDPKQNHWLKRVIMHLYEEGPFHIIVVPDIQTVAGGLAYGQALYEVGFWLQTAAPFRQKISSLQLLGEGSEAQGTLFALIYNEHNPIASDRKVFQGGLALCPAVDLSSLLKTIDRPRNEAQTIFSEKFRFASLKAPWRQEWAQNVEGPWLEFSLAQSANWEWLNPFRLNPPRTQAQWLQASDIAYQGFNFTVPSWLVGSRQDPRFLWSEHGQRLAQQNSNPRKSGLRSQVVEDFTSCAFGASLGWDVEGAIWRSLLLSQSYEIWPRQKQSLPWTQAPELFEQEQHLEQEWLVNNAGQVSLRFFIKNQTGQIREVTEAVDTVLWPEELRPQVNQNSEALRWQRLLNVRLRLATQNAPLILNPQSPTQLQWWDW